MVIGIDASRYDETEKTGTEWYSYIIINHLLEIFIKQNSNKVILYSPSPLKGKKINDYLGNKNIENRILPAKRLWTLRTLTSEMKKSPPDVLFVPSHVFPLVRPKKAIIMIHDTAFKKFRKAYSFFQYHYLNWSTGYACKNAATIIAPSKATKDDLIKFYKCPKDKIKVIYHGLPEVPTDFQIDKKDEDKFYKFFRLNRDTKFLLFIGRLEIKKNLTRMIQSFAKFSKDFPEYKFILAGKRGVGFNKIFKSLNKLNIWNKIFMPGFIKGDEKWFLLKNCEFLVFPSLYEGFGFPVLEAFQFKKPVITSNISSLPEVAGEGALLVNPYKTDEIADAMKNLAKSEKLRSELIDKSRKQLKKFSWEKAANEVYKILTGN